MNDLDTAYMRAAKALLSTACEKKTSHLILPSPLGPWLWTC
uniref:Alternative protein NDE1 n=1 Tax=Homo sapiens TaxID=9606 RepID=L8E8T4_HUMAN|nr:alternative protein NDE1 [Homo sapiens]